MHINNAITLLKATIEESLKTFIDDSFRKDCLAIYAEKIEGQIVFDNERALDCLKKLTIYLDEAVVIPAAFETEQKLIMYIGGYLAEFARVRFDQHSKDRPGGEPLSWYGGWMLGMFIKAYFEEEEILAGTPIDQGSAPRTGERLLRTCGT